MIKKKTHLKIEFFKSIPDITLYVTCITNMNIYFIFSNVLVLVKCIFHLSEDEKVTPKIKHLVHCKQTALLFLSALCQMCDAYHSMVSLFRSS